MHTTTPHPSIDAVQSVQMEDVTGDGLKDLLYLEGDKTYFQKNLGRGHYANPIDFEEARKTGYFGPRSEHEKAGMILPIVFGGGALICSLFLGTCVAGYKFYHRSGENIPEEKIPYLFRDHDYTHLEKSVKELNTLETSKGNS